MVLSLYDYIWSFWDNTLIPFYMLIYTHVHLYQLQKSLRKFQQAPAYPRPSTRFMKEILGHLACVPRACWNFLRQSESMRGWCRPCTRGWIPWALRKEFFQETEEWPVDHGYWVFWRDKLLPTLILQGGPLLVINEIINYNPCKWFL